VVAVLDVDVLTATKLHVPGPRPGYVVRERLLQAVDAAAEAELTLLCTPPGFGKTSLLAEWARQSARTVAWLSLDRSDSDPIRFWRYVVASLDPVCPALAAQLASVLSATSWPVTLLVGTLVNALSAQSEQTVLVLDDYHLIDAGPIHEAMGQLLERMPVQLRVVIAARSDPPLPLARLRARGKLAELRAADLRFTSDEASALLKQLANTDLEASTLNRLHARTEGWAVGLQLAALSLQRHGNPQEFVTNFSGTNRYVLDFLTEEVLARQTEQRVRFLLETSVLERLSADLCDAVTGGSTSQLLLEELEHDNVFLVALDDKRRWWRYHHLFADLLQARLRQAAPERLVALHRAAAQWFQEHAYIDEAIRHALAANDSEWAARLVEAEAQTLLMRNESATVHRWLLALPPELIATRALLGLINAIVAKMTGHLEDMQPLLDQAEAAFDPSVEASAAHISSPRHGLTNIAAMLPVQRAELARQRGDPESVIEYCRAAAAAIDPDDRYLQFAVRWESTMAALLQGRVAEVERSMAEIAVERLTNGDLYSGIYACYVRAQAQRALGGLHAAARTCEDALSECHRLHPGVALPPLGIARVGLAEVVLEQGRLDTAQEHAAAGAELCLQLGHVRWQVTGLAVLARVLEVRGAYDEARSRLNQAFALLKDPDAWTDLQTPLAVEQARLQLSLGDMAGLERWLDRREIREDAEPNFKQEREYLLLARSLMARGDPGRALALLQRMREVAESQARGGSVREIRVLEAAAFDALGEQALAIAALAQALAMAEPEEHLRIFVDGGARLRKLLEKLTQRRDGGGGFIQRVYGIVSSGTPAESASNPKAAMAALVDPLSERELEVLGLLATGMSNQQIAEELVVSMDTVKKHVSHILAKLDAASRTQAVARARELAIL
jgi:LuxR family transcriptional regulator, maltose regulon positive regulatory protein